MGNFEIIVPLVLSLEGGYVNDPDDPGGETKYGISKRSYPHEDIPGMTRDRAKEIYRRDFWELVRADEIPNQRLSASVFDMAINAGPQEAIKILQEVVGAAMDGIFGPKTAAAVARHPDLDEAGLEYVLTRIHKYALLAQRKPISRKFFLGWVNRALAVHYFFGG